MIHLCTYNQMSKTDSKICQSVKIIMGPLNYAVLFKTVNHLNCHFQIKGYNFYGYLKMDEIKVIYKTFAEFVFEQNTHFQSDQATSTVDQ